MSSGVLPSTADQFREAYTKYLREATHATQVDGELPSRTEVDDLRSQIPGDEGDQISYEVERDLGLPAVHPKHGN